ncbi:hypothetical protein KSP40_PGU001307 [Platanthera guangdongensis]|uniref:WLM domain-containing protein n=1 Tax=Platanthera guangdongensis TaxID=2320717 RepID=A0ABR2LZV7_9ASPA
MDGAVDREHEVETGTQKPAALRRAERQIGPTLIVKRGRGSTLIGKPIRMMGVFDDEINDVSQSNMHPDLRIAGFDEEDKRLRQLSSYRTHTSLKLPQGPYIFCDFRTLDLPGIKLNPPSLKALRIMHILACDPGIIAVMNKAHMVYSEHDVKFLSLEKQLNEEAADLDWTKSRSHSLTSRNVSNRYEDVVGHLLDDAPDDTGHKLGGGSNLFATARASSVAAAFDRYSSSLTSNSLEFHAPNEPTHVAAGNECLGDGHDAAGLKYVQDKNDVEPDLDDVDNVPDRLMEFPVALETNDSVNTPTQISDFAKIKSVPDNDDVNKVDSNIGLAKAKIESGFCLSDSDNMELQRIEEPVAAIVARLRECVAYLKSELTTHTSTSVLQTLSKIIRFDIDAGHSSFKFSAGSASYPPHMHGAVSHLPASL